MIQSFKGRQINLSERVEIYRNLHNGKLSIRQNGVVIGHCDQVTLRDVSFKVSLKGRERVLEEKRKNVHALVSGFVLDFEPHKQTAKQLTYNPYKYKEFVFKTTGLRAYVEPHEVLTVSATLGMWISVKPHS